VSAARPAVLSLFLGLAVFSAPMARAALLPPSCASVTATPDLKTPLKELRRRVEAEEDSDPTAAFALLCTTIPRVERERGAHSEELAWWTGALATPLIAYMDKFDEALPLLQFAQPILEQRYGRYGEPLGDLHVAYAWTYFRQGRFAESAAAWQEALKVRELAPGAKQVELQKVLVGLAQVQTAQRDFATAQRNLERAEAILIKNGNSVSDAGAAIENGLINVTLRQEDYVTARRHAEEELRIENQLHDGSAQFVAAYALLGTVLERLNEYDQAEQAVRHALDLSESAQGPLQRHHFSALYQLAALLEERGRAAEARDYALRALTLGESTLGASAPRLVPVLQTLGDAQRNLGEFADSLHRFERAGTIIAANGNNIERPWLVNYYRDFGTLQLSLGDLAQADQTLAAGLEAAGSDPTLTVARARLLLDRGRTAVERGEPESRDDLLQAAALLRMRLPEGHPAILRVLNELCALDLATAGAATTDCEQAAMHLEQSPAAAPALRAAVEVNLSRLALLRQDQPGARAHAIRAVAAAETSGIPEALWQGYLQLALTLRASAQTPEAIFFGKQAVAEIEQARRSLVGTEQRYETGFLRDKVAVYRSVADWLMESGRLDEGLAVLQLMKREEQSDFGIRDASVSEVRRVDLTSEEATLLDRYQHATQSMETTTEEVVRLGVLEESGRISPSEQEHLDALLAGLSTAETARAGRIEQLLQSEGASLTTKTPQSAVLSVPMLAQEARVFGKDTAFAVYLLTSDHLRVLVSAGGHQAEFVMPLDAAQLQRDIGNFLDDIAHRRDPGTHPDELYEMMLRRVDEFAAANHVHRLTLWLDGALRYVPVAALRDGHRYLLDKYVIQIYSPAVGETARIASNRAPRIRGLGVTQAIAGFPALPAVADELCFVIDGPIQGLMSSDGACPSLTRGKGALSGEGFADATFTEARLRDLLGTPGAFSVLHIGTHFRLRPGNALRSYLLLGDGSQLTLDTINTLSFQGVDLVTLSACQTGLGGARSDDGREIEGLSALVQRRGAGKVIATLWPVEDTSTAQLMRTLYGTFAVNHGDAALGLQRAQQALRVRKGPNGLANADPYYWAGFFVASSRP
jgi:CHAT domain-containing protein/tetratricopeptide (TPR) repeat protein